MTALELCELAPSAPLRASVRRLAGFSESGSAPTERREVPLATCVIVFSLGPDLWVILGVPLQELFNRTVAIEDVLPGAALLTERLAEAQGWREREAIVASVLGGATEPAVPAAVRQAYHRIVAAGGDVRIGELAEETGWSRRHLTQRFREELGMAPKAFGRLVRFERAARRVMAGEAPADVAYACGYADQPHMNRDFRAFYGGPPGELPFVQDAAAAA